MDTVTSRVLFEIWLFTNFSFLSVHMTRAIHRMKLPMSLRRTITVEARPQHWEVVPPRYTGKSLAAKWTVT
jgi:hypothetical protein